MSVSTPRTQFWALSLSYGPWIGEGIVTSPHLWSHYNTDLCADKGQSCLRLELLSGLAQLSEVLDDVLGVPVPKLV